MAKTKYLASVAITAAVLLLSFIKIKGGSEYPLFPHADKCVHAIMYFALTAAFCYDSREKMRRHRYMSYMLTCIGAASAIGIITELGQEYLTDYRSGDIYDFFADAAGSILGAATAIYIIRRNDKTVKKTR